MSFSETGIRLTVTPHVTANRQILMNLRTERSAIVPLAAADLGYIFTKQLATNQLLVNDGETAVIGGLTVTEVKKSRSGIPLLSALPLVGKLFAYSSDEERRRDLIILVTPRIIDDGQHDELTQCLAGVSCEPGCPPGSFACRRRVTNTRMRLRFTTAGESHGQALVAIVEGLPAGLPVSADWVDRELARRMQGYGRGARMKIEQRPGRVAVRRPRRGDPRHPGGHAHRRTATGPTGRTSWSPEGDGRDPAPPGDAARGRATPTWWACSSTTGSTRATSSSAPAPGRPRPAWRPARWPAGCSRSSAWRSAATWCRWAGSAPWRPIALPTPLNDAADRSRGAGARSRAPSAEIIAHGSTRPRRPGDTLGGEIEVVARGLVLGLGSHVSWDRKLDGRLAGMLMSIPAVKGVEIGLGFEAARRPGSAVHDPIDADGDARRTVVTAAAGSAGARNNAGGLEGGMTTGEPLVVRVAMKPISTLMSPLPTVDLDRPARPPAPRASAPT